MKDDKSRAVLQGVIVAKALYGKRHQYGNTPKLMNVGIKMRESVTLAGQ